VNLKWTNGLSVSESRIDKEHQLYFELLNHICVESEKGGSKEKLTRLLNELTLFIRFHFMAEENLMIDSSYDDYDNHRAAHIYCMESLKTKMFDFRDDNIKAGVILDFATEWFLMHISSHDKRLGSYMALQSASI